MGEISLLMRADDGDGTTIELEHITFTSSRDFKDDLDQMLREGPLRLTEKLRKLREQP